MTRAADGFGYWAAFLRDGEFAGIMMLPRIGTTELGYRIVRRFWRRGLATEGSLALLAYAFDTMGEQRVTAETMAVNAGSRAVMERVGMSHVRTFFVDWDDPLPGSEAGEVEYEITRPTWRARAH